MYLRQASDLTIGTLADTLDSERAKVKRISADTVDVEFHMNADTPAIKIGEKEVPADAATLNTLGDYMGIPKSFHDRLRRTADAKTLDSLYSQVFRAQGGGIMSFHVADKGKGSLTGIFNPKQEPLDLARMARMAGEALGTQESPVERLVNTPADFAFDVRVPEAFDRGIGGDKPTGRGKNKVGDITAAGVRAGVDLKHGLAPYVEPWFYRLFCTNGCGTVEPGLRIDARGQTMDEIFAELSIRYAEAFRLADERIAHYYDLRNQRVDNPERAVRAIARERDIPDRSVNRMLDRIPTEPDFESDVTMFDVVNLITNEANNPAVTRDGGRLILERVGGAVVTDHASRCSHCQQTVKV